MSAILILNYKTADITIRLVEELLGTIPEGTRILVVDNASPNGSFARLTEALAGYAPVEVIASPENGGFAKGNNFGLRYLERYSPEFVCIVNNDVHFDGALLPELERRYRELPDSGVIAPLQLSPDGHVTKTDSLKMRSFIGELSRYSLIAGLVHRKHPWKYEENTPIPGVQAVDLVPGSFLFVDYALFKENGFFDESTFLFWEEQFLYRKMQGAGKQNYILLDRSYIHEHSASINSDYDFIAQSKLLRDGFKSYVRAFLPFAGFKCALVDVCSALSVVRFKLIRIFKPKSRK